MILIGSAAYLNPEFSAEFGRMPPAMLPLANRRLYRHQIQSLRKSFADEAICLSLPADYPLSDWDREALAEARVSLICLDPGLGVGVSLLHALETMSRPMEVLRLLHGDTLVEEFPIGTNVLGLVRTSDDYGGWEVDSLSAEDELVWGGYFAFADVALLQHCVMTSEGDFVQAVHQYHRQRPLVRCEMAHWYDFGHINTYYHSRSQFTTERAFNKLRIEDAVLTKTGQPGHKIQAEYLWFRNLPARLKVYAPQLISGEAGADGAFSYALEYLPLPPLNELYVHGCKPPFFWGHLFRLLNELLLKLRSVSVELDPKDRAALIADKSRARVEHYLSTQPDLELHTQVSINGTFVGRVEDVLERCIDLATAGEAQPGLVHGDLCLSNILYDPRADRVKLIDPRGLNASGAFSSAGDLRYDLAKLSHSVLGLYDHIIAGAFRLEAAAVGENAVDYGLEIHVRPETVQTQKIFLASDHGGLDINASVLATTVLLFMSMASLHADHPQRQAALWANAFRFFSLHLS